MTPSVSSLALPRTTPEAVGVPSTAVLAFLDALDASGQEVHSLMLSRRGQVFAEGWWFPYSAERPHLMYSLSKSFTSTAIGMLSDESRISIDDPVISFFPDETPDEPSANLRAMRVRDLLSMSSGHASGEMDTVREREDGDWVRAILAEPVTHVPGTHFVYNNKATYLCSAILTRITGETLLTYLTPRLFEPLGIEGATWQTCPKGNSVGASGLSVRTEDIAKLGNLYLQKGEWNGRRLVSEAWVEQATSRQVSNGDDLNNDWNQGYGFQFWRSRHGAYRGDGAFGQYCVVIPETSVVVAITSSATDMGVILQAVWDHLRYAPEAAPFPEDDAHHRLRERLGSLELPPPAGEPFSPVAAMASRRYVADAEKGGGAEASERAITFQFREDGGAEIELAGESGRRTVPIGGGAWNVHRGPKGNVVATRGAWTAPDAYTFEVKRLDGPERRTITARFEGDRVVSVETKAGYFGPAEGRRFEGRAR